MQTDPIALLPESIIALHDRWLIAIVVLLIGLVVVRICSRILLFILRSAGFGKLMRRLTRIKWRWEQLVTKWLAVAGYLWVIATMLRILGFLNAVFLIVVIALAGILLILGVLKLLFFLPNWRAGRLLFKSRAILLGKSLALPGLQGKIVRFSATEITLKTATGELFRIPHAYLRKYFR